MSGSMPETISHRRSPRIALFVAIYMHHTAATLVSEVGSAAKKQHVTMSRALVALAER